MEEHGYRIDDTLTLEGPTGYTCQVPLAFQNGRHGLSAGFGAFLRYHGLEAGDYAIFTLTANSHLVVKIYSKHGCQKTEFPGDVNEPKSINSHLSKDLVDGRRLGKRRNRRVAISSKVAGRKQRKVNREQQADESESRRGENCSFDQDLLKNGSFKYGTEHHENGGSGVQEEKLGSKHYENGGWGVQEEELGSEHHENGELDVQGKELGSEHHENGELDVQGKGLGCEHDEIGGFGVKEEEKLDLPERIQQLVEKSSLFFEELEKQHLLVEKIARNNPLALSDECKDDYNRNPARTILAWIRPEKQHSEEVSPSPHQENCLYSPKKNTPVRDTGLLRWEHEVSGNSVLNSKTAAAMAQGWSVRPKRTCSRLFDPYTSGVENGNNRGHNVQKPGSEAIDPALKSGQNPRYPSLSDRQRRHTPQVQRATESEQKNLRSDCDPSLRVRPPEENLKRKEMLEAAEALKAKTYPSAIMVMSRTYITRGYTVVPKSFGRKWLPLEKKAILLEDTTGQTWPVVYNPSKHHITGHLGRGWRTFAQDKHLKEGDLCVLEMKSPYSNNLFVHIFRFADYMVSHSTEGHVSHTLEPSRHGNGTYKDNLLVEQAHLTAKPPRCEQGILGSSCKKRDMTRSEELNAPRSSETSSSSSEEGPSESLTGAFNSSQTSIFQSEKYGHCRIYREGT
ncbi:unnamed protein product [Sphagnum balticum]